MRIKKFILFVLIVLTLNIVFAQFLDYQRTVSLKKINSGDPSDMPCGHNLSIADFKTWVIESDPDAPFNRSSVQLKNKFINNATQVNAHARPDEAGVSPLVLFSGRDVPSQGSSIKRFTLTIIGNILILWAIGAAPQNYALLFRPDLLLMPHIKTEWKFLVIFFWLQQLTAEKLNGWKIFLKWKRKFSYCR